MFNSALLARLNLNIVNAMAEELRRSGYLPVPPSISEKGWYTLCAFNNKLLWVNETKKEFFTNGG